MRDVRPGLWFLALASQREGERTGNRGGGEITQSPANPSLTKTICLYRPILTTLLTNPWNLKLTN
jgi:hypothetical protein